MNEDTLTAEEISELEYIKKVRKKVSELVDPIDADVKANQQISGSSVYNVHNVWVAKPHHFTYRKVNLDLD